MSANDCILYRKIGECVFILPYASTNDTDISDEEFSKRAFLVPEYLDLMGFLERLNSVIYTEHGICYGGTYESDAPDYVPKEHRILLVPDSIKEGDSFG